MSNIRVVGPEVSLDEPTTVSNTQCVYIAVTDKTFVTIENEKGVVGSFTMVPNQFIFVKKNITDTIQAPGAKGTPCGFQN